MTKQETLELIKLLSAIESWSFAISGNLPDYLLENIDKAINRLSEEVLK